MQGIALLSTLIWLPVAGGLLALLIGDARARAARWVALLVSLLTLGLAVCLWSRFDTGTAAWQFVERLPWIPMFHAEYHLGIDGISLPLIALTAFMTVPVIIASWSVIEKRPAQYYAAFLILEGLMIGVFSALDTLLFYFFWEAMLIPMFLIIGVWGGPRRVYATIKFFLYTFLGSVFMLVALVYMYLAAGSYSIDALHALPLTLVEQRWIFLAFLLAFAVKVPMWPVHTWLPAALQPADRAGRESRTRLDHHRAVADRGGLHRLRRAGAAGHEEAGGVFLHRAHGLRHAGRVPRLRHSGSHRHAQRRGRRARRRNGADGVARPDFRRAVPLHRRDVRPRAQP
jgi:NADH-quinone oxidoreductase subunit M